MHPTFSTELLNSCSPRHEQKDNVYQDVIDQISELFISHGKDIPVDEIIPEMESQIDLYQFEDDDAINIFESLIQEVESQQYEAPDVSSDNTAMDIALPNPGSDTQSMNNLVLTSSEQELVMMASGESERARALRSYCLQMWQGTMRL